MNAIVYNSLKEYFDRERLTEGQGDLVSTLGFESENDGGAANYIIESTGETANNELVISGDSVICKGFKLRLLPENGIAYVEQFGAKGDYDLSKYSETDKAEFYAANSAAIQLALNSGISDVAFSTKTYLVSGGISITKSVNIIGHSATVELKSSNTSVFHFNGPNSMIENAKISDLKIKGIISDATELSCTLLTLTNVFGFTMNNIKFDTGNKALNIHRTDYSYDPSSGIRINNCSAINVNDGFDFDEVYDFKIQNCRIEMCENGDGIGLNLANNTGMGTVEDLSVLEGYMGVNYSNSLGWRGYSVERILFKNLLIGSTVTAIELLDTDIPVHFANTMIVDSYMGMYMSSAKNVTMTNSSVHLIAPAEADEFSTPIGVYNYAQAKFTHTQFDFPLSFQRIDYNTEEKVTSDLVFVDCTLQKTDIADVEGVTSPSGFGLFGVADAENIGVNETFDACEFRSYIQDYSITAGEGETTTTTYNFPVTLSTASDSGSKLIIKNCRFVNDKECTIPYFKLDDGAKFDNIVVYNCFFENYSGTENSSSTFPIFGRIVNGSIVTSNEETDGAKIHNIFAKRNMRSSASDRTNGTAISEMLEYQ